MIESNSIKQQYSKYRVYFYNKNIIITAIITTAIADVFIVNYILIQYTSRLFTSHNRFYRIIFSIDIIINCNIMAKKRNLFR